MPGVVEKLRTESDKIWSKIFVHPFVVELYSGTLPIEKFRYYVIQDYNYLVTLCKCFSLIASKADYSLARRMLELAHEEATIEMANYENLLEDLGITLAEAVEAKPSPTNVGYMSFLLSTCALGSPLEGIVALLPCFWSYAEIASRHEDKLKNNSNEVYVTWAKTYSSREYVALVEELKRLADEMASEKEFTKLAEIFTTASRYEYMFWDMAYRMESWPI